MTRPQAVGATAFVLIAGVLGLLMQPEPAAWCDIDNQPVYCETEEVTP